MSCWVADNRLLARSPSPERQSRSTHSNFMPDIGLEPVEGQDHTAMAVCDALQTVGISIGETQQFIIALQQRGDRARSDDHLALTQGVMNLGDAAAVRIA